MKDKDKSEDIILDTLLAKIQMRGVENNVADELTLQSLLLLVKEEKKCAMERKMKQTLFRFLVGLSAIGFVFALFFDVWEGFQTPGNRVDDAVLIALNAAPFVFVLLSMMLVIPSKVLDLVSRLIQKK